MCRIRSNPTSERATPSVSKRVVDLPVAGELLDAVVTGVDHVDIAFGIDHDPVHSAELTVPAAERTPLQNELGRVATGPGLAREKSQKDNEN